MKNWEKELLMKPLQGFLLVLSPALVLLLCGY
jgi:hypothetical protein